MDSVDFSGKVALVTGAGSGIGQATSKAFAALNARVVVNDINAAGAAETIELISAAGGEALFVEADVSRSDQVESMISQVVSAWGRLDFACNNAGMGGVPAKTADCTEQNWDRETGVMFKGVWLCMKYELLQMLKNGGGNIVNIASVAGQVGYENVSPTLSACKFGVIGLTKTAALEYAQQNIRVNAVCPGTTLSQQIIGVGEQHPGMIEAQEALHPMGRLGQPAEIADAVTWLCSGHSTFVTGHTLTVDGGYTAQ